MCAIDFIERLSESAGGVPALLERALEERWRKYRKVSSRCREGFEEKSVHQLRVETRRLLALLDLLLALAPDEKQGGGRRVLKKSFNKLSRLRDTQVQLVYVEKLGLRFPGASVFAGFLARRERRLTRKLGKQLQHAGRVQVKELAGTLRRMARAVRRRTTLWTRGEETLWTRVDEAFTRVAALRTHIDPGRPATLHRTRIAFKKFRYLAELLQPLLPEMTDRHLEDMRRYQTLMGDVHDLEVLRDAIDKFSRKNGKAAPALQAFRREIDRLHAGRVERYLKRADDLFRLWPRPKPQGQWPQRGMGMGLEAWVRVGLNEAVGAQRA